MSCEIGKQLEGLAKLKTSMQGNYEVVNKIISLERKIGMRVTPKEGSKLSIEQKVAIQVSLDGLNEDIASNMEEISMLKDFLVTETDTEEINYFNTEIKKLEDKLGKLDRNLETELKKLTTKNKLGDIILNEADDLSTTTLPEKLQGKTKLSDYFQSKTVVNTLAFFDNVFGENFNKVLTDLNIVKETNRYLDTKELVNDIEGRIKFFVDNKLAKDTKDYEVSPKFDAGKSGIQSPSRFLVALKDGKQKLPDAVVTAMAVGAVDWLASDKDNRGANRSINDSKKLHGIDTNESISEDQLAMTKDVDGFFSNEVEALGSAIYKNLGLKAKEGHLPTERKLKIELGMMALYSLDGIVNIETRDSSKVFVNPTTEKTKILKFTKDGNTLLDGDKRHNIAAHARRAMEILGVKSKQDLPSYDAPLGPREVKAETEHKGYNKTQQVSQNAVNRAESVGHNWNERFTESYFGMIEEEGGRDRLERIFGKKDSKKAHVTKRLGVEGKNNSIKADMRHLEETFNDMQDKGATKMYFGYKIIKSMRFYMKSSTFNPQGKKLHRFSSYAGEPSIIDKDSIDDQKLGMALAFHLDVDKKSKTTIMKEWDVVDSVLSEMLAEEYTDFDILETFSTGKLPRGRKSDGAIGKYFATKDATESRDSSEAIEEQFGHGKGIGEVAHLLGGIVEYKAYKKHLETNDSAVGFKSMLQAETDAVTSGFILKLLQMPLGKGIKVHLARGGVFIADENGEYQYTSFGKMAEMSDFVDSYQYPASVLTENINGNGSDKKGMLTNLWGKLQEDYKQDKIKDVKDIKTYIKNRQLGVTSAAKLALGVGYKDKITEVARSFMKNPFMIFNYGAGMGKIKGEIATKALEDLYGLMEDPKNYDEVVSILTNNAPSIIKFDKEVDKFLGEFTAEGMLEAKIPDGLAKVIKQNVEDGIGAELERTFQNEYEEFIDASNKINNSFTVMFRLFKAKLDTAIIEEQYRLGSIPTDAEVSAKADTLTGKRLGELIKQGEHKGMLYVDAKAKALKEVGSKSFRETVEMKARAELFTAKFTNKKYTRELTPAEKDGVIAKLSDSFPAIKTALAESADELLFINKTAKVRVDETFNKTDVIKEKSLGKIRLNNEKESIQVGATMYDLIESFASGGVVSIHGIDASIQAVVMSMFDSLGVHDANMFMAGYVKKGTAEYNRAVIEISKKYSITQEVANALASAIQNASPEEITAVNEQYSKEHKNKETDAPTVNSTQGDMIELNDEVQVGRQKVYSKNIRSAHASYEDAEVEIPGTEVKVEKPKKVEDGIITQDNKLLTDASKSTLEKEVEDHKNKCRIK